MISSKTKKWYKSKTRKKKNPKKETVLIKNSMWLDEKFMKENKKYCSVFTRH